MIRLRQAVVCEGKYDQIKLDSIIDGLIIPTNGFGIFKDAEKLALIRRLAQTRGVVILTDSDAAGFQIRSYLEGCIPDGTLYHAYIPDIPGKERRKGKPSSEGKLGVEGVSPQVILEALERAGVTDAEPAAAPRDPITRLDLYNDGLTGGPESKALRQALLKRLELPARLSVSGLLAVINAFLTREEYREIVGEIRNGFPEKCGSSSQIG